MAEKNREYRRTPLYKKGVNETISSIIKYLKSEEKVTRRQMQREIKSQELGEAFRRHVEAETYEYLAETLEYGEMDTLDQILCDMEMES